MYSNDQLIAILEEFPTTMRKPINVYDLPTPITPSMIINWPERKYEKILLLTYQTYQFCVLDDVR